MLLCKTKNTYDRQTQSENELCEQNARASDDGDTNETRTTTNRHGMRPPTKRQTRNVMWCVACVPSPRRRHRRRRRSTG